MAALAEADRQQRGRLQSPDAAPFR